MIAVIGVGSPFGADQMGWQVIDALQRSELPISNSGMPVTLFKLDRPGSGIVDQMQNASAAILIDAVNSPDAEEKEIVVLSADQLLQSSEHTHRPLVSSHGFGLLQAIQLAEKLNLMPDKTSIVGMNILFNQDGLTEAEGLSDQEIGSLADKVTQIIVTL